MSSSGVVHDLGKALEPIPLFSASAPTGRTVKHER